jgi:hypothetical protein
MSRSPLHPFSEARGAFLLLRKSRLTVRCCLQRRYRSSQRPGRHGAPGGKSSQATSGRRHTPTPGTPGAPEPYDGPGNSDEEGSDGTRDGPAGGCARSGKRRTRGDGHVNAGQRDYRWPERRAVSLAPPLRLIRVLIALSYLPHFGQNASGRKPVAIFSK